MEEQLTREEEEQLRLIARGLRTNEKLNYNRATLESLIKKGFIETAGIGVRLTSKGQEALRRL